MPRYPPFACASDHGAIEDGAVTRSAETAATRLIACKVGARRDDFRIQIRGEEAAVAGQITTLRRTAGLRRRLRGCR